MKYSRHQIDNAGDIAISSKDEGKVKEAIDKINDWRSLHLPVVDDLQKCVNSILESSHINVTLSSRRLKRLTSILYKLDLNPDMGLGGMQDIGGLRLVLPDIHTLNKTFLLLKENVPDGFILSKEPVNYVEAPKDSGYRGIHFVYKGICKDYNGLRVELQIRTELQHYWAMAVETAELITKTRLKSSQGADEWLEFFKIVSSLFAAEEKCPILACHYEQRYSLQDLMKLLYELDQKHKFCDTLKALRVTNHVALLENYKNKYYILNIKFLAKKVGVTAFSEEQSALETYSKLEKKTSDNTNAVVLVAVSKCKELQEAYPSYFLDTSVFLKKLDNILNVSKSVV